MLKKEQLYLAYYAVIGSFLLLQVVFTIYQTSLVVAHGHQQRNLEKTQAQLAEKKQLLQENLAKETSLLAFEETHNLADYQLIANPIVIDNSVSLAAAN